MERVLDLSGKDFPLFLLAFFRITGVVMVAPVFGNPALPARVKIFLSLLLAVLFFPLVDRGAAAVEDTLAGYALAAAAELGVGLVIGFASALLFAGVQFGGHLIDQELGLMLASVIDPISNEMVSVVGQFKVFLAVIVYLLIDGHHALIAAVSESFASIPPAGVRFTEGVATTLSDTLVGDMFRMAVQIAAPAMATLFLITIAMAFLARAVPEMNLFAVGLPLRLAVGLGVVAVGVGLFALGFQNLAGRHSDAVRGLIRLMGGA